MDVPYRRCRCRSLALRLSAQVTPLAAPAPLSDRTFILYPNEPASNGFPPL